MRIVGQDVNFSSDLTKAVHYCLNHTASHISFCLVDTLVCLISVLSSNSSTKVALYQQQAKARIYRQAILRSTTHHHQLDHDHINDTSSLLATHQYTQYRQSLPLQKEEATLQRDHENHKTRLKEAHGCEECSRKLRHQADS